MGKGSLLPADATPTLDDYIMTIDLAGPTTKHITISQLIGLLRARRVVNVVSNASLAPNCDTTDLYIATALAVNTNLATPTGAPSNGQSLLVRIKDNGTSHNISYSAVYRAIGVTAPTSTVAGKNLYMQFIYNADDSFWDLVSVGRE